MENLNIDKMNKEYNKQLRKVKGTRNVISLNSVRDQKQHVIHNNKCDRKISKQRIERILGIIFTVGIMIEIYVFAILIPSGR